MLRKFVMRHFGKTDYKLIDSNINLRSSVVELEQEVSDLKGQVKVDQAEVLHLKSKMVRIRELMGRDDEAFSRFTRKQIEAMSIEDFNDAESEIDKDMVDGKIFLQ
jgi:predicted  nucleic acid-binding Zn-ribbon protein